MCRRLNSKSAMNNVTTFMYRSLSVNFPEIYNLCSQLFDFIVVNVHFKRHYFHKNDPSVKTIVS